MNNFGVRTMNVCLVVFAVIVVTVFIIFDTYDCLYDKKFKGNLSIVSTSTFEKTQVDLRMHIGLQSRLHTANIDVVNCMIRVDTSLGDRRLEMLQGTIAQQPPIIIKPKPLWSAAWNGNDTFSILTRTMVISNINYTNLDMFLSDAMVTHHTMVINCVIDGSVDLFSVMALRIPTKKYTFTVHKDLNLNQPQLDSNSDQNILQLLYDFSTAMSAQRNQEAPIDHATDNPTHSHSVVKTSIGNDTSTLDETDLDPVDDDSNSTHHMETTLNEVSISPTLTPTSPLSIPSSPHILSLYFFFLLTYS